MVSTLWMLTMLFFYWPFVRRLERISGSNFQTNRLILVWLRKLKIQPHYTHEIITSSFYFHPGTLYCARKKANPVECFIFFWECICCLNTRPSPSLHRYNWSSVPLDDWHVCVYIYRFLNYECIGDMRIFAFGLSASKNKFSKDKWKLSTRYCCVDEV